MARQALLQPFGRRAVLDAPTQAAAAKPGQRSGASIVTLTGPRPLPRHRHDGSVLGAARDRQPPDHARCHGRPCGVGPVRREADLDSSDRRARPRSRRAPSRPAHPAAMSMIAVMLVRQHQFALRTHHCHGFPRRGCCQSRSVVSIAGNIRCRAPQRRRPVPPAHSGAPHTTCTGSPGTGIDPTTRAACRHRDASRP